MLGNNAVRKIRSVHPFIRFRENDNLGPEKRHQYRIHYKASNIDNAHVACFMFSELTLPRIEYVIVGFSLQRMSRD